MYEYIIERFNMVMEEIEDTLMDEIDDTETLVGLMAGLQTLSEMTNIMNKLIEIIEEESRKENNDKN